MDRLASTSVADILERAAAAITAGCVNIVSVESIRERSGERWPRKREQVEAFVLRAFQKAAAPADLIIPLNEAEFLTIQPDASRTGALSRSSNILRETLQFFLGAAAPADVRILQVTSFAGGSLNVQPVDQDMLGSVELDSDAEVHRAALLEEGAGPGRLSRSIRLEPPGVDLKITSRPEAIWSLCSRAIVSYELRPMVTSDAPPADWAALGTRPARAVAMTLLEHAQSLLEGDRPLTAGLHLPIPATTIGSSEPRYQVLEALKALRPDSRRKVIVELTGLGEGIPPGRLAEMVAMVAPHCRAVLARTPGLKVSLASWRHCKLAGVSVDCASLAPDGRNTPALLAAFCDEALKVAPACVAYRLPSRSALLAAWAHGFTHVSGRFISEHLGNQPVARRFEPLDLYAP